MDIIHQSSYKNIKTTLSLSLIIAAIGYLLAHLVFGISLEISLIGAVAILSFAFIYLGRQIIVRHSVDSNKTIRVEFLLRPSHYVLYSTDTIQSIEFKVIDRGRYGINEKGIIILKGEKNYHRDFMTFSVQDELKWFWTNFKYPNRK